MTDPAATNPVLAEVVRGGLVESIHRGSLVVLGSDGSVAGELGSVRAPMYPRSSNKPLQALGMLRAGLDIDETGLALACASHSGEDGHARRVLDLLYRHGLDESDLACPADYPGHSASRDAAIRSGAGARRVTMNCSGKHAAMVVTCLQRGWPLTGYTDPAHPLQQTIAETFVELTGEPIVNTTVDGCGAPLFAATQAGLATAFRSLGTADDGAQRRVADAMRANPWLIAGSGQPDTLLMLSAPGVLAKGGAEAVQALALPDGTAIVVKVDDGAKRALGPVSVALIRSLGVAESSDAGRAVLDGLATASGEVLGAGHPVGRIRIPPEVTTPLALEGALG